MVHQKACLLPKSSVFIASNFVLQRRRNRGAREARALSPRNCNKQGSALFIFRKCPLFLKENSALEVLCPPKF